jgi:hypothetical protein
MPRRRARSDPQSSRRTLRRSLEGNDLSCSRQRASADRRAQERECAAVRAAEEAGRRELDRKAIADAQKIVAIWNARQAADLVVLSNDGLSPASYQRATNFSSPDNRHSLRDRASVPGRRTAKSLATIHDPVQ